MFSDTLGYAGGQYVFKYSKNTGINQTGLSLPDEFVLMQNFPNPFNPSTKISYKCQSVRGGSSYVSLKVFDVLGKEAVVLVNQKQSVMNVGTGSYEVEFDGSNFPSGIYFYSLAVDGVVKDTKRIMLLK